MSRKARSAKRVARGQHEAIWRAAALRRGPGKITCAGLTFKTRILDATNEDLMLENTLSHLDEVQALRQHPVDLHFPYKNTMLKTRLRFIGLATVRNVRAIKFALPEELWQDDKRSVKRIQQIPAGSRLVFSTSSMWLGEGRIRDVSPGGVGFAFRDEGSVARADVASGDFIDVDLSLGEALKLSFRCEIRHIQSLPRSAMPLTHQMGVKILDLDPEAQESLNQWLFEAATRGSRDVEPADRGAVPSVLMAPSKKNPRGILVVSPHERDLNFLHQVLHRKFDVMTSDFNMANIRTALSSAPRLMLVYLEHKDKAQAAFTRKLCGSLQSRVQIALFGFDRDPEARKTAMGSLRSVPYIDISQRKVLQTFQAVNQLMGDTPPAETE